MREIFPIIFFVALSTALEINPDVLPSQSRLSVGLDTSEVVADDVIGIELPELKPFASFVYQLIYPDLFKKAFDTSFSPFEAAKGLYNTNLLYSQFLGLPCSEEGSLPFVVAEATKKAFERGITPLSYFAVFMNDMEDYLKKMEIMTPCNVQLLGYKYYEILAETFKCIDESNTPISRMYNLGAANAKFMGSFGVMPHGNEIYNTLRFIKEWNRV